MMTTKRTLILFGLDFSTAFLGFVGFLFLVGSAGALEHSNITELQFLVQSLIAFLICGLAFLVGKVRNFLSRYFERTYKNN